MKSYESFSRLALLITLNYNSYVCGISLSVGRQLPKLDRRVRLPYTAFFILFHFGEGIMSAQAKTKRSVEEKYGISKRNGIMLFIQMILIIIGLVNACLSVYDGVMSGLGMMNVIVAIVDVLAFVAVIHYSVMGFRRQDDLAFIGVIYVFTAALLFKQIAIYDGILLKIIVGIAFGINDNTYGYEQINGTDFIVTSGISDWAMDFKTGTHSEYVIIDVT